MSDTLEPQQLQVGVEDATADQSLDASTALQSLINELNEGDILVMADEIEACIARTQERRERELEEINQSNEELREEIKRKEENIRTLTKINDVKADLIKVNFDIANFDFSPVDKSQDLFQAIRIKDSELYNLKVALTQEKSDLNDDLGQLIQKRTKLQNELNELNEKLENPEPKENIDPEKLREYDLALLKINFYRNLGIRIESFRKPESTPGAASEAATTQDPENANDLSDDPEYVVIVTNSEGEVKTMPVGLSCPEESVSRFIWENID
ncbi:hypothetical protein CORT_0A09640 [Candida orthopsilosis Co 90-125]|uniref:Kinetochore protein Spc24 n=1 Tax=Candida orthopsilosis (strain 90-125) TaxID=1136231 RepID=H8WYN4_CANO9|nr:hypothetical protein CORT_0A09640 [Candida orthopsilosis Co 90-125]CCG21349.1 hypothetical protein CORT_0A09640 [Candida orthopsilosis Co 90-125]